MVGALGVNQAWLFTAVFALGAVLAGLGGALQLPREPANLDLDLASIGDAFVVVVVGGMGSIPGAYRRRAADRRGQGVLHRLGRSTLFGVAFSFSKLTLVVEFLVMARGAGGAAVGPVRPAAGRERAIGGAAEAPLRRRGPAAAGRRPRRCCCSLLALPLLSAQSPYVTVLRDRHAGRGAVRGEPALHHGAGRHAFVRPRRLFRPRRLRRRAAAARAGLPMEVALVARRRCVGRARRAAVRLVLRAAVRRLPRDADAGVRADRLVDRLPVGRSSPAAATAWSASGRRLARRPARLLLPDARCSSASACVLLRRMLFSPFGYALRAGARFAAARRRDRHRRAAHAVGRVRRRRRCSPAWPARCSRSRRAASRPTALSVDQVGRRRW